jgi:hypothetical protein
MPWLIGALILIGALANHAATYIYREVRDGRSPRLGMRFSQPPARQLLLFYVIAGLPIAFLNGLLLRFSWADCLIVGIGTWLGMLALIALSDRFRPVPQFFLFAGISIAWMLTDIGRALARHIRV